MRRLLLVLFVGLVSVSTSGVLDLVVPEPCSIEEDLNGTEDGDCAATCVRCNCCSRSIEVLAAAIVSVRINVSAHTVTIPDFTSSASPAEILHVPKLG